MTSNNNHRADEHEDTSTSARSFFDRDEWIARAVAAAALRRRPEAEGDDVDGAPDEQA